MVKYGQFCPVAKAAEIVGERWTLLILRELLSGSTRYADLQRGLGRISPSVLSQRLTSLCDAGLVVKRAAERGTPEYLLTECGRELMPLVQMVGTWGQRWVRSKMPRHELDVDLLTLDMQRNINPASFPDHAVLHLRFTDLPVRLKRWWILIHKGEVDVCNDHPGRKPLLEIETTLRTMTEIWMGDITFETALDQELLRYEGPAAYRRKARQWLGLSALAGVKREAEEA